MKPSKSSHNFLDRSFVDLSQRTLCLKAIQKKRGEQQSPMFEIPGVHHRAILFPAFPRDRPNNEEWLGNHELRRTSQKKRHQNLSGSSARCLSFSAGVKSLPGATIHLKSYSTSILDFCSSSKTQYRLHEVHEQRPRNSVAISVGMRGVACKMIRALRYRATTIDHDIPITSYVSLIRRVQRSTKAL